MSQLGHSRPNWAIRTMSGLLPLATELRTSLEVRFVPIGDIERFLELKKSANRGLIFLSLPNGRQRTLLVSSTTFALTAA